MNARVMRFTPPLLLALVLVLAWLSRATPEDARAASPDPVQATPADEGRLEFSPSTGPAADGGAERRAVAKGPEANSEDGYFLDFYVTDPEGAPVPRVQVSVFCAGRRGGKSQVLEDEGGRYRVSVSRPLPTQLFFWNRSLTQLAADTARDYPVPSTEPAHVVLYPHGGVAGTVLHDDGSPYTETVWLLHGDGDLVYRGLDLASDGSFFTEDLRPGTYRCFVEDWPSEDRELTILPGEVTDGVNFVVPRQGSLRVVVQGSGQFVNYAEVEVFDSAEHVTSDDADRNGNVVFDELRPGTYWVTASMFEEPNRTRRERVEVFSGEETTVLLDLPELPITLRGRILNGEDTVDAAELHFSPVSPVVDGFAIPTARARYGHVDDRGNYELKLDRTGVYEASVLWESKRHRLGWVEVSALGVLHRDFHLPRGSISGRVIGLEDLSDLTVWIQEQTLDIDGGRLRGTTQVDSSGEFSFEGLPPGHYDFWASQPGGDQMGLVGPAGLALAAGERLEDVEIRAVPAGALDLIVRDASGNISVGADVHLLDERGIRHPIDWQRRGARARYRQLPPGPRLVVAQWLDQAALVNVEIKAGITTELEIAMEQGGVLVICPDSEVRHRIVVYTSDGYPVTSLTPTGSLYSRPSPEDHLGRRTVGPLPPGKYRVVGLPDKGQAQEHVVDLEAGQTLEVPLEF